MKLVSGLCALMLALALAGCGGTGSDQATAEKKTAEPAQTSEPAQTATREAAPAAQTAGTPTTLAGTLGCGHCNYEKTAECAAAIQTAGGEVYVIDGVTVPSPLWSAREARKQAQITGTVAKGEDGLMHLAMTSYQLTD